MISLLETDISEIKLVYKLGIENGGRDYSNIFNPMSNGNNYNVNIISSKTFFCDLGNEKLIKIIKKYIPINDKTEYISNIHYIKYLTGEEAKPHADKDSADRTFIMLLNDNFEGGDFYLENEKTEFKKGDLLEFDSSKIHSVKKIEKGEREVLVIWVKKISKDKKSLI